QYRITNDGTDNGVIVTAVRDLNYNGSIAEGYMADDEFGFIYIAEEDLAIHKYYADPALGSDPISSFASGDGTASTQRRDQRPHQRNQSGRHSYKLR
ncbi:MAG: phytase, partial [bacterium]